MQGCSFYKIEATEENYSEKGIELNEKSLIYGQFYYNGFLYFGVNDGGYVDPSWTPITEEEMYNECGCHPFDPEWYPGKDDPQPDPVDPTMSQLVNIIVETSVNVDYLVSMQSFQ